MEVIRGRERDCRQEVRSAVERGGTRPTRRVDPQRQAFLAVYLNFEDALLVSAAGLIAKRAPRSARRGATHN
jgi:hypothetical protein